MNFTEKPLFERNVNALANSLKVKQNRMLDRKDKIFTLSSFIKNIQNKEISDTDLIATLNCIENVDFIPNEDFILFLTECIEGNINYLLNIYLFLILIFKNENLFSERNLNFIFEKFSKILKVEKSIENEIFEKILKVFLFILEKEIENVFLRERIFYLFFNFLLKKRYLSNENKYKLIALLHISMKHNFKEFFQLLILEYEQIDDFLIEKIPFKDFIILEVFQNEMNSNCFIDNFNYLTENILKNFSLSNSSQLNSNSNFSSLINSTLKTIKEKRSRLFLISMTFKFISQSNFEDFKIFDFFMKEIKFLKNEEKFLFEKIFKINLENFRKEIILTFVNCLLKKDTREIIIVNNKKNKKNNKKYDEDYCKEENIGHDQDTIEICDKKDIEYGNIKIRNRKDNIEIRDKNTIRYDNIKIRDRKDKNCNEYDNIEICNRKDIGYGKNQDNIERYDKNTNEYGKNQLKIRDNIEVRDRKDGNLHNDQDNLEGRDREIYNTKTMALKSLAKLDFKELTLQEKHNLTNLIVNILQKDNVSKNKEIAIEVLSQLEVKKLSKLIIYLFETGGIQLKKKIFIKLIGEVQNQNVSIQDFVSTYINLLGDQEMKNYIKNIMINSFLKKENNEDQSLFKLKREFYKYLSNYFYYIHDKSIIKDMIFDVDIFLNSSINVYSSKISKYRCKYITNDFEQHQNILLQILKKEILNPTITNDTLSIFTYLIEKNIFKNEYKNNLKNILNETIKTENYIRKSCKLIKQLNLENEIFYTNNCNILIKATITENLNITLNNYDCILERAISYNLENFPKNYNDFYVAFENIFEKLIQNGLKKMNKYMKKWEDSNINNNSIVGNDKKCKRKRKNNSIEKIKRLENCNNHHIKQENGEILLQSNGECSLSKNMANAQKCDRKCDVSNNGMNQLDCNDGKCNLSNNKEKSIQCDNECSSLNNKKKSIHCDNECEISNNKEKSIQCEFGEQTSMENVVDNNIDKMCPFNDKNEARNYLKTREGNHYDQGNEDNIKKRTKQMKNTHAHDNSSLCSLDHSTTDNNTVKVNKYNVSLEQSNNYKEELSNQQILTIVESIKIYKKLIKFNDTIIPKENMLYLLYNENQNIRSYTFKLLYFATTQGLILPQITIPHLIFYLVFDYNTSLKDIFLLFENEIKNQKQKILFLICGKIKKDKIEIKQTHLIFVVLYKQLKTEKNKIQYIESLFKIISENRNNLLCYYILKNLTHFNVSKKENNIIIQKIEEILSHCLLEFERPNYKTIVFSYILFKFKESIKKKKTIETFNTSLIYSSKFSEVEKKYIKKLWKTMSN